MSRKQLSTEPGTLDGLQVHLKLTIPEKKDLFRWRAASGLSMREYATRVFKKHIRDMREREKSEPSI